MPKVMNFSENLEKGFEKIGHRVRENIEKSPEVKESSERAIVKESIVSIAREVSESPSSDQAGGDGKPSLLPSYFVSEDGSEDEAKRAVEHLVDMTLHGDLEKAIQISKKYPAFVEDAFHDALVDKLVPELKKKGILP